MRPASRHQDSEVPADVGCDHVPGIASPEVHALDRTGIGVLLRQVGADLVDEHEPAESGRSDGRGRGPHSCVTGVLAGQSALVSCFELALPAADALAVRTGAAPAGAGVPQIAYAMSSQGLPT